MSPSTGCLTASLSWCVKLQTRAIWSSVMSVGSRLSHTIFGDIKMIDFGMDDVFTKLELRDGIMNV